MKSIYEEVIIDEISRQKANISSAKESPEDEKIDTIDQSILKAKSERDSN
ncbi:MAG: hypothetical protein R2784_15495 [Saprospiraceae bacterium]